MLPSLAVTRQPRRPPRHDNIHRQFALAISISQRERGCPITRNTISLLGNIAAPEQKLLACIISSSPTTSQRWGKPPLISQGHSHQICPQAPKGGTTARPKLPRAPRLCPEKNNKKAKQRKRDKKGSSADRRRIVALGLHFNTERLPSPSFHDLSLSRLRFIFFQRFAVKPQNPGRCARSELHLHASFAL